MRPAGVVDLPRVRAALARLDMAVAGVDARGRRRLGDFAAALAAGDPAALATLEESPMPQLRNPETALSVPFTLRLAPPALAELDALAERLDADPVRSGGRPVTRQAAGRMALERGVRTLAAELSGEDLAERPGPAGAPLDLDALAAAILARLEARGAVLARVDAPAELDPPAAGTEAPRVDRRGPLRLTDADRGAWVKALGAGNKSAHRLARIGGGGVAEFTCGATEGLRNLVLAAEVGGKRRCARCEAAP